jgi:hypothetical protein
MNVSGFCGYMLVMYDGEYEGECERPLGHEGDHCDGLSWYDDDAELTDEEHGNYPVGSKLAEDLL